jgi:hypothetical protein
MTELEREVRRIVSSKGDSGYFKQSVLKYGCSIVVEELNTPEKARIFYRKYANDIDKLAQEYLEKTGRVPSINITRLDDLDVAMAYWAFEECVRRMLSA